MRRMKNSDGIQISNFIKYRAAVTTWNYDGYRGFLTNKAYADGHGPVCSYTAAGRLQTRLWARGTTTTYGYDNAGSPLTVGYSDVTPGLTNAYDRLGRQVAVTNGATVCSWTYNNVNEPLTKSYTDGPLNGLSATNGYDQYLRRTSLSLLNSSAVLAATAYATTRRPAWPR
jgi:YD repeat-containing protein